MFGIGPPELIVIFLVVLLLFGGRKIPEIGRGLGRGMREFRKAKDEIQDTFKKEEDEEDNGKEEKDNKDETSSNQQTTTDEEEKS